jgi:hypothetical protein
VCVLYFLFPFDFGFIHWIYLLISYLLSDKFLFLSLSLYSMCLRLWMSISLLTVCCVCLFVGPCVCVCVCVYRLHGSTHYTLYTACIDTAILLIGVGERDTGEAASGWLFRFVFLSKSSTLSRREISACHHLSHSSSKLWSLIGMNSRRRTNFYFFFSRFSPASFELYL